MLERLMPNAYARSMNPAWHIRLVPVFVSLFDWFVSGFCLILTRFSNVTECRQKQLPGFPRRAIKGILSGGATSEPMEIQQNDHIGPDFGSCIMDVPYNISATTQPIFDFDGVLEPPDP